MPSRWAALHEGLEPCRVSHGCVVCLGWDTRGTVLVDASARHASLPETDFTISAWFKTSSPDGAIFSVVRARATESKPMESELGLAGEGPPRCDTAAVKAVQKTNKEPNYAAIAEKVNRDYSTFVNLAATRFNIPAQAIKTIICIESSGEVIPKSEAGHKGLMQVGKKAWDAVIERFSDVDVGNGKKMGACSFSPANYHDAQTNIMFGTAYRRVVESEVIGNTKGMVVDPKKDPNSKFSNSHPEYATILNLGYNAGSGTVAAAMRSAQSTLPTDFTTREHFEPAIRRYDIHSGARAKALDGILKKAPLAIDGEALVSVAAIKDFQERKTAWAGKSVKEMCTAAGRDASYSSADNLGFEDKYAEVLGYVVKAGKFGAALEADAASKSKSVDDATKALGDIPVPDDKLEPNAGDDKKEAPVTKRYRIFIADLRKSSGPFTSAPATLPPEIESELQRLLSSMTE